MSMSQVRAFVIFALIVGALSHVGAMSDKEWRRISRPLRGNYVPGLQVDMQQLNSDARKLSVGPLASREVGSEGSKLAQAYIARRFQEIGLLPFGAAYAMPFAFTHTDGSALFARGRAMRTEYPAAVNLVGLVRGSEHPERYIVVSARYDTRVKTGMFGSVAYDGNSPAVASMLAIAAHMKQHPPRNSIVFAAFDGGLLNQAGAYAFVASPPFAREQIAINLNVDGLSSSRSAFFFVAGTAHMAALLPIVESAAQVTDQRVQVGHDQPFHKAGWIDDWSNVSDHGAFRAAGIPFLFASVEEEDQPGPRDNRELRGEMLDGGREARYLTTLVVKLDENLDAVVAAKGAR